MTWLIDTDVFIEGERGNPAFVPWLESVQSVATADIVRGEFHCPSHRSQCGNSQRDRFPCNGLPLYKSIVGQAYIT